MTLGARAEVDLGCPIDVASACDKTMNCEYTGRPKAPLHVYFRNPKIQVTVYEDGRLRAGGVVEKPEGLKLGMKILARRIRRLGHPQVKFRKLRFTNLEGYYACPFKVNLQTLGRSDGAKFDVYSSTAVEFSIEPRGCAVVGHDGNISCVGMYSIEEMQCVVKQVLPTVHLSRCEEINWSECRKTVDPAADETSSIGAGFKDDSGDDTDAEEGGDDL